MKKRILSLLLVLILLVTVSVFAVEADETEETPAVSAFPEDSDGDGAPDAEVTYECPVCGGEQTWYKASVSSGKLTNAKHVYVPSTSTGENVLTTTANSNVASRSRCLWLVGDLAHSSDATAPMFWLYGETAAAVLNIMGTGKITNNSASQSIALSRKIYGSAINELVMWGGEIDCSGVNGSGRGLVLGLYTTDTAAISAQTKFRMEDGTLRSPGKYSAFNFTSGGYFEMNGGTIYGANAGNMGGVLQMNGGGTFTMTGGTIYGGDCTSAGATTIDMEGTSSARATFTMTGGTIDGGTLTRTSSSNGTGGNIYLNRCDATISGGTISGGAVVAASGYARGGNIYATNSTLAISGDAVISGGSVTSASNTAEGGNIYTQTSATLTISGGTIQNGSATTTSSTSSLGGNILSRNTVTMSNGTIQDGSAAAASSYSNGNAKGGNVYVSEGTFTMTGGTIQTKDWDGRQCNRGGNLCVVSTFNLQGGTVKDGNANHGGNVLIEDGGVVTVSGGVIRGGEGNNGPSVNVQSGGKLNVADGFTGVSGNTQFGLYVYIPVEGMVTDGVVSSEIAAATDGYTNGGKVFVTTADTEQMLVVGNSAGNLVVAGAVDYNGTVIQKFYETAQDAVNNSTASYVQLRSAPSETLSITKETYLDVNGYNVTLNIGSGVALYGMDSNTNDYDDTDAAVVTLAEGSAEPQFNTVFDLSDSKTRKYLYLADTDGNYGFHRYYLSMSDVLLRPYNNGGLNPGLLYGAVFYGDQAVADAINDNGSWGIKYTGVINNVDTELLDVPNNSKTFVAGSENVGTRAAVYGYLNGDQELAEFQITGTAYITIGNETVTCSNPANKTMQDVVSHAYNLYNTKKNLMSAAQIAAVEAINTAYGTNLSDWWGLSLNG